MLYVALIAPALLIGFLVLIAQETARGERFLAARRAKFDAAVARFEFFLAHAQIGALLKEALVRALFAFTHEITHRSLAAVRVAERFLTRLVRRFHAAEQVERASPETVRPFVRTLADFKGYLEATRSAREREAGETL